MAQSCMGLLIIGLVLLCAGTTQASGNGKYSSALSKVIQLLQEMKSEVQKQADEDSVSYDKYKCWCETNGKEKQDAIEAANQKITEFKSAIEENEGKHSELTNRIKALNKEYDEDLKALNDATQLRMKEKTAFQQQENELKNSGNALVNAVQVLSNVQGDHSSAKAALLQVSTILKTKVKPGFRSLMKEDFWDLMDSLQAGPAQSFMSKRSSALQEPKPNGLKGAVPGAKNYNSRSGQIFGLLSEMKEEMQRDLEEAQREEREADESFTEMQTAKNGEMAASAKQLEDAKAEDAEAMNTIAISQVQMADTEKQLAVDEKFLASLQENCQKADEEYAARVKNRNDEITALGDTLQMLTNDDTRDLMGRTQAFLQVSAAVSKSAQERMSMKVFRKLAAAARLHRDWALAGLAVRVRLDTFTKVKEEMDKMTAELQKQQKEDNDKYKFCSDEIDSIEDSLWNLQREKKRLDDEHLRISDQLETDQASIADMKKQIYDMQVGMKVASENRKEENKEYQSQMDDQQATVHVLKMALTKLKEFYMPEEAEREKLQVEFVQISEHTQVEQPIMRRPDGYDKHGAGSGVIQLLSKIISDAKAAQHELQFDENQGQKAYAEYITNINEAIANLQEEVASSSQRVAEAQGEKSRLDEDLTANAASKEKYTDLLHAQHVDCDFVLKYYRKRQTARSEEIDAIADAKAVLSGSTLSDQ